MKNFSSLLALLVIASCLNRPHKLSNSEKTISSSDTIIKNYTDTIKELENLSTIADYDTLGQVVSKIRFDVKTNDLKDYETGKIPWIRIDSPQIDMKNLIGKDQIVIPENNLTVIIDYPLSSNYRFELSSKNGFTRSQLIAEISKHYYQVYEEEEQTATIKTIPLKQRRSIYNRNRTNGKYGIWGHDISDLVLDEIHVYKNSEGKVFCVLQMES